MKNNKVRVNINISPEQKELMQQRAEAMSMNLTEYILHSTLNNQSREDTDLLEALRQQLQMQRDKIEDLQEDVKLWQEHYKAAFQMAQMGMWHSLPFWKKLFSKPKEIDTK